jgi:ATP-dependent Lon protease
MSANRDYLTPELRNWLLAASFGDGAQQAFEGDAGRATFEPLPETLDVPVVPLRETVVFPRGVTPLSIGRDRSLRAIEATGEQDLILTIAQKVPDASEPRPSDLYAVGTVSRLGRILRMPDGTTSLLVRGQARARIVEWLRTTPFAVARVEVLREPQSRTPSAEALMRAALSLFERVIRLDHNLPEEAFIYAMNVDDPGWLADLIAQALQIDIAQRQSVLETLDPAKRLQKVAVILARELDVLELEDHIQSQVQNEVGKCAPSKLNWARAIAMRRKSCCCASGCGPSNCPKSRAQRLNRI